MPGRSLGIRNDNLVGGFFENVPKSEDFRGRAAAASRRIGLVRDEDGFRSDLDTGLFPIPLPRSEISFSMT